MFTNDNKKMQDFVSLTQEAFLNSYSYITIKEYNETHKHHPNYEDIKEFMDLYNADEIGMDDPITMDDAEFYLLNSDKYHYNNL